MLLRLAPEDKSKWLQFCEKHFDGLPKKPVCKHCGLAFKEGALLLTLWLHVDSEHPAKAGPEPERLVRNLFRSLANRV